MIHNVFPLIEICVLFLALAYTSHIIPTLRTTIIGVVFIALPSTILLFIGSQFLFVAYLTLSSLIICSYFTKSLRAFIDLCSLTFGALIFDHVAYRVSLLFIVVQPETTYIYYSTIIIGFAIFTYYYKRFITKIHPRVNFSSRSKYIIIFTSTLAIFLMYLNTMIPVFNREHLTFRINLLLEVIFFTCMFFLIRSSTKWIMMKKELDRLEVENKHYTEYMQSLEDINREMKKFQHDYANILLTIRGYLEIDDLNGLKQYYQSHILKAEQKTFFKNEVFRNLDNLKVVELKGLLATKVIHADHLGIKLNVEIPEEIEAIDMDIIDLTRIIGILTDNAIEACLSHNEAEICISFVKTNHHSVLICIDNTIEELTIDLDDIYKENFSTKGKNRGIGLTNVKEILKRYHTVQLTTQIEDGWFMQELEIPVRVMVLTG